MPKLESHKSSLGTRSSTLAWSITSSTYKGFAFEARGDSTVAAKNTMHAWTSIHLEHNCREAGVGGEVRDKEGRRWYSCSFLISVFVPIYWDTQHPGLWEAK